MGFIVRGCKNAFRNGIRTSAIIVILGLSIGLALVMLLSYKTVQGKINAVKGSIGNTITVSPAGARGFEGGGEPLTEDQANSIKSLANVTSVSEALQDRVTAGDNNNLTSAIDPGTLGARFNRGNATTRTFTIPISVTGVTDTSSLTSGSSKITSGSVFDGSSNDNVAVIGTGLATKNNLNAGSTFTAYGTTITVKGIFDAGNQFANSGIYMPVKSVERLSGQTNNLSEATVTVNSIENIDSTVTNIKNKLGVDKVDLTSSKDSATQAITPLENIRSISLYSLIGALIAASIIVLLTMVMIVRERRREIGVLKAIGASDGAVMLQFMAESLCLTLIGSVIGIIAGVLASNPILKVLINNNTATPAGGGAARFGGGAGGAIVRFGANGLNATQNTIRNLNATVGWEIIVYGLLAAVAIAIIGSAIPSWLIAKVRPAEVMRGE